MRGQVADRFWSKVQKTECCWLWKATLDSKGYAHFTINSKRIGGHRWAYEEVRGPIPKGLVIDHLCETKSCVNPWHLEPVTLGENIRRGTAWRHLKERNSRITHCPKGHEYTVENTYLQVLRNGHQVRSCRYCRNRYPKKKR